jgi:hypothetical protein
MGNTPKILVCGGRNYGNMNVHKDTLEFFIRKSQYQTVFYKLECLCLDRKWHTEDEYRMPVVEIVSGMATGADNAAVDWATTNWLKVHEFPADWKKHGKGAGPIRNQQMIDEGKPNLVVAFPGGNGTADMVRRAKKAGIEVIEVTDG